MWNTKTNTLVYQLNIHTRVYMGKYDKSIHCYKKGKQSTLVRNPFESNK